jgi:hypothetical protein
MSPASCIRLHVAALVLVLAGTARAQTALDRPLPAFPGAASAWLNSPPLRVADLAGQVVLLDVWTFGCWNCTGSLPWLKGLDRRFAGTPFRVIGIHSPEFAQERGAANVAPQLKRLGVSAPTLIDDDMVYWNALDNRYWPAFYLVDKHGRLRALYVGETHPGSAQAQRIEAQIQDLLAEP